MENHRLSGELPSGYVKIIAIENDRLWSISLLKMVFCISMLDYQRVKGRGENHFLTSLTHPHLTLIAGSGYIRNQPSRHAHGEFHSSPLGTLMEILGSHNSFTIVQGRLQ